MATCLSALSAIGPAVAQDVPELLGVEVRGDPQRLRFTLDISETVPFYVDLARGTRQLRIDLPTLAAAPDLCATFASPYVAACSAGRLIFGYYRIAITLSFCGTVDAAVMEDALGDMPARLFVDVVATPFLRCE